MFGRTWLHVFPLYNGVLSVTVTVTGAGVGLNIAPSPSTTGYSDSDTSWPTWIWRREPGRRLLRSAIPFTRAGFVTGRPDFAFSVHESPLCLPGSRGPRLHAILGSAPSLPYGVRTGKTRVGSPFNSGNQHDVPGRRAYRPKRRKCHRTCIARVLCSCAELGGVSMEYLIRKTRSCLVAKRVTTIVGLRRHAIGVFHPIRRLCA